MRKIVKDTETKPAIDIPHDIINEQIVIAAALIDKKIRKRFIDKIPADYFIDRDHGLIWSALQNMNRRKLKFDLQTLHHKTSGQVELSYLQDVISQYSEVPVNMNYHINTLKWDYIRADTIRGPLTDLLNSLQDPTSAPEKIRGLSDIINKSFHAHIDRSFMKDPGLLARQHVAEMKGRQNISVYPFGIDDLDKFADGTYRMIPGAAPKMTTLITAVSGSGKSVLAAYIALQHARMGRKILYGAWEMGPGTTLELITMMSLKWSRYDVSTVNLSNANLLQFELRMEAIGEYIRFFNPPFMRDPNKKYTNEDALNELHGNISDSGCDEVILDLWERCIPDGGPGPERRALFRQQQIAQETGVHQILVCQQKIKEVEASADKRPARNTILGSSAWVDIADTIIGVHNPSLWKSIPNDKLEIPILKQRYGKWPLAVEFDWDPDKCTLNNGIEIKFEPSSNSRDSLNSFLKP